MDKYKSEDLGILSEFALMGLLIVLQESLNNPVKRGIFETTVTARCKAQGYSEEHISKVLDPLYKSINYV